MGDALLDSLPAWLIDLLYRVEAANTLLLIAIIGGWIAGELAGRRSARLLEASANHLERSTDILHEQLIASLQPSLRILHPRRHADGERFGYRLYISVEPGSMPARLISVDGHVWCPKHGESHDNSVVFLPSDVYITAHSRSPARFLFEWEKCSVECVLEFNYTIYFSDSRNLRTYERDPNGLVRDNVEPPSQAQITSSS